FDCVGGQNDIFPIFHTFDTREKCIAFAEEQGLIPNRKLCRVHKTAMAVSVAGNSAVKIFRCRKGTCRTRAVSRAKRTWFENAKIPLPQVFYLMYAYASHWSQAEVRQNSMFREPILSSSTICDWYNDCREAVVLYQIEQQVAVGKIGGPGKKVQIDESKFGKRKFNKGNSKYIIVYVR
ncbi:uncharacterized protein LOC114805120, partial [Zeugodacus cucurbitae]|uniref:uncharacterized protein LOC114805120 n=1 Tax=Zeugodacus cucurbitae TaxID=28588 RepID=UPI0023D8F1DB